MQTRNQLDTYGVDLSSYQGTINWEKLKAQNVKFAILRAYGSNHSGAGDTHFETYVSQARMNNIPVGAYYFATPTPPLDLNQARTQAQQFINKLQSGFGNGNFGDLTPFVDIEHNPYATTGQNITDLTKAQLISWIEEFRNYFETNTNKKLGIYCGEWFMKDSTNMAYTDAELQPLSSMPLWVAEYERYWTATRNSTNPAPNNFGGWTSYVCWQFSDRGDGATYGVQSQYIDINVTKDLEGLRIKMVNETIEAPIEPVEPIEIIEPIDTVEPTEPVPPTESVEPVEPTDPTEVLPPKERGKGRNK